MAIRFELCCAHCEQAFEYPARCLVVPRAGSRDGPSADVALVAESPSQVPTRERVPAYPTICLRCGQLGVHRADSRRWWRCDECGSLEVHQLGFDPRVPAALVGVALAMVLVGLPATSSIAWALPGLVLLGILLLAGWLLERQGQANLARAPCTVCGERGLSERRVRVRSALPGSGEPVADRQR